MSRSGSGGSPSSGAQAARAGVAPRSRFRIAVALAMVLGGAAWLQSGGLVAPFFADDFLFLDQARGRSLVGTLEAPDPIGNYFRPVSRQVWFWGLSAAAGESSPTFHAANLALFLIVLALLYRLAGRLLPRRAALAAVAVVAVHHAADVPLLWASGSQDLLAVAGSLAAVELCAAGRAGWAALPMLIALLSKETVVFAPLIAVLYDRRSGEPLSHGVRRAWPLFAAMLAWLGLWVLTTSNRPAIGLEVHLEPAGLPAALAHLAQTALAIEWPHQGLAAALRAAPPLPVLAVASGVALAGLAGGARRDRTSHDASARRHAIRVGVAWALLGALPVAAVAQIWSAYHYLFALCGVALALGGLVAAVPAWVAPLLVLLVGWTSENARRLPEFATARGPWTAQSHVNRHYLERGMTLAMRFLADLRRARPTLPRRSTLYFAGVPSTIAFQSADGPLVRWAYGDTTLRSYFMTRFQRQQARRGPTFFFRVQDDTLTEIQGADSLERIGFALILSDAPVPARDVLALAWDSRPGRQETAYRMAWVEAVRGDLDATRAWLAAAGHGLSAGPAPEIPPALARVAAGDTAGAIALTERALTRHGLDAGAHALLADLLLAQGRLNPGTIEAYAARSLAPEAPSVWRRWGLVELVQGRDEQAALALERYLELGGEAAREDEEIQTVLRRLRRRLPGGAEAQAELGGHRFRRRSTDQ